MSRANLSLPMTLFQSQELRMRLRWSLRELDRQKRTLLTIRTVMVVSLGLLGFSCAFLAAVTSDVLSEQEASGIIAIRYSSIFTWFLLLAILIAEIAASLKWNDSEFYRSLEHRRGMYHQMSSSTNIFAH